VAFVEQHAGELPDEEVSWQAAALRQEAQTLRGRSPNLSLVLELPTWWHNVQLCEPSRRRVSRLSSWWEKVVRDAANDRDAVLRARPGTEIQVARNTWTVAEVATATEKEYQSDLLRDIFGVLPFRKPRIEPAWLAWNGGVVGGLAEAAYQERETASGHLDPARLAILADALEEAGAADSALLGHLRGPGPHVRGCQIVDAVLGKTYRPGGRDAGKHST
jgi:hypothetical protein